VGIAKFSAGRVRFSGDHSAISTIGISLRAFDY
jgi:hypothetical protein